MALQVELYNSIYDIDEKTWDSILERDNLLHSHRFIRAVEDGRIENSRLFYFVVYDDGKLIASTALSLFSVALDLFLDNISKRVIDFVRKLKPEFLRIRVLFCGLPISLGQHNLVIAAEERRSEVINLLTSTMDQISSEYNVKFQCAKEFSASQSEEYQKFAEEGFFQCYSIPTMKLALPWKNFSDYLSQLRHGYRRNIKQSFRKAGVKGASISILEAKAAQAMTEPRQPVFIRGGVELCPAPEFYGLYLEVMKRTPTKLEVANQEFFERMFEYLKSDLEMLVLKADKRIISVALLTRQKTFTQFLFSGRGPLVKDRYDSYFNTLYAILQEALESKSELLKLGQEAYWPKQRLGATAEELYLYFKAKNRLVHFILGALKGVIFPQLKLKTVSVFKSEHTSSGFDSQQ